MKNLISITCFLLVISACSKTSDEENPVYSDCIKNKIDDFLKLPVNSPKTYIKKYIYNGQTVYLVNTNNPDGAATTVYNEKCEIVCATGGTIAGESFDTCINWDKAIFVETVWVDNR